MIRAIFFAPLPCTFIFFPLLSRRSALVCGAVLTGSMIYFIQKDVCMENAEAKPVIPKPLRVLFTTLGVLLALFLLFFAWQVASYYRAIQSGNLSALPQFTNRFTRGNFADKGAEAKADVVTPDDPALGEAGSPLTIVQFMDFECPYSKEVFSTLRQVISESGSQVRLIVRDFPLDEIHSNARRTAAAANCAGEQGRYFQMYDKLFLNSDKLSETDILFYGQQIGLNMDAFRSCLADPATDSEINDDIRAGTAAGIRGTPTFFFNGQKIEGAIPLPIFRELVKSLSSPSN
ncbi:hypothetical protein A3D72_02315 [Candidatus Uhrbacteria bacterium RIFCSPHIGHO2_02_FULL_57_19]|uniref:Thioredoxin domain-containing protein n=1 Tax=Candidatus Uhrbacteria bacterium RIFCSPHIGHO2_02_FULL_57_19 TaxID=1802391 RepID=A0A1F7U7E1_9BACT|nr:MAG: hypothetical protein A3D72_02315 [Candidatus Uhrbacteria bacterium RIFCSPHIGHO2_02_FULL_57_19]